MLFHLDESEYLLMEMILETIKIEGA